VEYFNPVLGSKILSVFSKLTQNDILLADSEHHPAQTRTVLFSHPSRTNHLWSI